MKFSALFAALVILLAAFALALPDTAEAARMGGGRSFGSKPFMSTPAQRPAMRQQAPAAAAQAQDVQRRPGMFGGMGGIFGGLLAGTLLGSLLGGGGFSGGGLLDIIMIGLLIYLGLKLFARFRQRQSQEPAAAAAGGFGASQPFARTSVQSPGPSSGWDALRSLSGQGGQTVQPTAQAEVDVPSGFDVEEFLRGAKMAYSRMQKAWDQRDLDDIAQFATPAVMDALKEQMAEDSAPGNTEILLVNAQLLGVENEADNQRAQVFFDVLMREQPNQAAPSAVREVWHFLREGANGAWKLDGIQQVE